MSNNNNSSSFSPNDVSFLGNDPLRKDNDTTQATIIIKSKDVARKINHEQEIENAVRKQTLSTPEPIEEKVMPINRTHKPDRVEKRSKAEKATSRLEHFLNVYATEPIGNATRISAMEQIVKIIQQFPVRSHFTLVLNFFREHKNKDFLREENALQCTSMLAPETRMKVEMLYHIFYSIAKGTASHRNISLDTIRSVFVNDELVNFVGSVLKKK